MQSTLHAVQFLQYSASPFSTAPVGCVVSQVMKQGMSFAEQFAMHATKAVQSVSAWHAAISVAQTCAAHVERLHVSQFPLSQPVPPVADDAAVVAGPEAAVAPPPLPAEVILVDPPLPELALPAPPAPLPELPEQPSQVS